MTDPRRITETDRLRLREFTAADAAALHAVLGDPEVMHYSLTGARTLAEVEDTIRDFCEHYRHDGYGLWAVVEKSSAAVIGFCGIKPLEVDGIPQVELGYRLARAYWGRGLATEAATAVRDFAFHQLHIRRLVAAIEPANTRSRRVAEKLGMRYWRSYNYRGRPCELYALSAGDPGEAS